MSLEKMELQNTSCGKVHVQAHHMCVISALLNFLQIMKNPMTLYITIHCSSSFLHRNINYYSQKLYLVLYLLVQTFSPDKAVFK